MFVDQLYFFFSNSFYSWDIVRQRKKNKQQTLWRTSCASLCHHAVVTAFSFGANWMIDLSPSHQSSEWFNAGGGGGLRGGGLNRSVR